MRLLRSGAVLSSSPIKIVVILLIALALPLSGRSSGTVTNLNWLDLDAALFGGGTVTIACDGVIYKPYLVPETISTNTVIDATGHHVILDGWSGWGGQMFVIESNATLTLNNLTIADCLATTNGSVVFNLGTNIISNCLFSNNVAQGLPGTNGANGINVSSGTAGSATAGTAGGSVYGGAIYNQGVLIANGSTFAQNEAIGGAGGSGGNGGNSTTGSPGNGANGTIGGTAYGGAIFSTNSPGASLTITNCYFLNNEAAGGNGGSGGDGGVGASTFGANGTGGPGTNGFGGALYIFDHATIVNSTFFSNFGFGGNGGNGGQAIGGAVNSAGGKGGNGYAGAFLNVGTNSVINCTFNQNEAAGGEGGFGGAGTISGGGGTGGAGGNGYAGGIYSSNQIGLTNCSIVLNGAFAGTGGFGGFPSGTDGANGSFFAANVLRTNGTFTLKNSLFADGTNYGGNGFGTFVDAGENLSDDNSMSLTGTGSHSLTNILVATAVGTFGGPTPTLPLLPGGPAINSADSTAAPQYDQRGFMRVGPPDIGASEYGSGTPSIYAAGSTATLDGTVGLFAIGRIPPAMTPLTVNYTISGTASNGVDYVQITNSVTIQSTVSANATNAPCFVRVPLEGILGAFSVTNKSVTLTLNSSTNYQIDPTDPFNPSTATIVISPQSTFNSSARLVRGTSTAPDFQSFVIPLNFQTGVPLAASGGNAATLFPGNQWTNTLYHFDATNSALETNITGRIPFQNPIVAFGSPVGGSPMFLNQSYGFGIHAGDATINYSNALRIQVYYQSNSAWAGTISLPIPNTANSNQLANFVTNGFSQTFTQFGLQTVWSSFSGARWGVLFSDTYILTHTAISPIATNYYFVVEEMGNAAGSQPMVLNQSGTQDWSKLYAMEFNQRPANLATFINQPHFDQQPLPPAYTGATLAELTNVVPVLPNLSSLVPSNYLTIDGSPELRRHPILDQFVANMGNDPLALANYVVNEIGLVDTVDYDTNYNSLPAVNLGGVNRSALATFQEGQGSPMEQCALLVYLLRQAGVPATYLFPTNGGLQMLTSQASKLLRVQLHGAVNPLGQTNLPQLIALNYPWVAAYVGTNWVQIFPWIKDTEITEGFNFYDYMPTNYNSGYNWLAAFINNDTNIFSLSSSDQPLDLLPAFIQHNLDLNHYGLSVDDMGVQYVNRRHLFSQWSQLPEPFALTGAPLVIESLKTNMSLFNTLEIQVYSQANPSRVLDTTAIPIAELHDRRLLLKFEQIGTNNLHNMILSLDAYSANVTNSWTFSTRADPTWALASSNQLDTTDDNIIFQVTHTREHFLPGNYIAPAQENLTNLWGYNYFEQGTQNGQSYVFTDTFRKGDLVAFCFDLGNVTPKMLNVYAQELWQFNQTANTNEPSTINPDIYEGVPAYLLGMSYFNYVDQFKQLNSSLHKVQLVSQYQQGYGLLRPQRDSSGNLINGGQINLITPAVHMPDNGQSFIFNASLHPDSGQDFDSAQINWWMLNGLQASAAEHGTLRSFYQTNAISTVKLLQQVAPNMVMLDSANYLAVGQTSYNGVQLQNADPTTWGQLANFFNTDQSAPAAVAFVTPGIVTNGTFAGVGALYASYDVFASIVSGLNGGYANNYPTTPFTSANSINITVAPAPAGSATSFQLLTTSTAANSGNIAAIVNGATASWTQPITASSLANGQIILNPSLNLTSPQLMVLYGSQGNAGSIFNQLYNNGTASTDIPVYSDWTQTVADPVNMMTGEFYIDSPDITLPGPMPLQIRRNYSSQNLAENEFGFGWKMSYVPFLSVGTNSMMIYAAEMDGSMVAYRQTTTNTNLWLPEPQDNPMLNNNSSMGIGSTGNMFNNRLQLSTAGGTNTYTLTGADGSTRSFVEASYPIGTFTRQRPYLNRWQDNRGNFYVFQYGTNSLNTDYGEVNRIQSSNGNFAWFVYDVYGHIIEAHTGDGRILEYVYDEYGDLVSVTLPDQMEIDYAYQHSNYVTNGMTNVYSTHLIVEEDKPDGRVLQNVYDSQRRVTNQLATAGLDLNPVLTGTFFYTNNFSLSSPTNPLTGVTVVSDFYNHSTTYYYTNSLIQVTVDPLNQTTVQTWYQTNTPGGFQRSLASGTDNRGLLTTYLYDSFGNLTNSIVTGDLTGNGITTQTATNSASYNTNNLPVQITDAVGNSQVVVYDPVYNFQPQQIIRYAGSTPISTNFMLYGNATNVAALGNITETNVAYGILTRTIRAYGSPDAATNDSLCDGQGYPTNTIQYSGTGDPNVTNALFYDERGELIQRTDGVGANYTFAFDPMGRPTAQETFDTGQADPMDWKFSYYDANGEINWIDGPRYNPEDYIFNDYDGAGRPTTQIHWRSEANPNGTGVEAPAGNNAYAQTFNQYDPLGNVLSTIDPRGAVTTNAWDALCRLAKATHFDTNGTTVLSADGYSYEPGGLVRSHTNALGGVTTTFYTTSGKPEARFNADGSTNAWRYYLDGRIFQEVQGNGAYWQTTYNDANRITTKIFYSAAGVPEATNSTQIDRRGNVIQKVDANGNIFTTAFDGLDRVKVTAGPAIVTVSTYQLGNPPSGPFYFATNVLQQIVTNFYDVAGRVTTNVNAIGEKTITRIDAIGRTTSSQIYSVSNTLVREMYLGYSADHNSVTTTNGSGSSTFVNTAFTDNDGHTVLSIAYPNTGTNELTLNQFDLAGNSVSQQHDSSSGGVVTIWTMATNSYDGLNRLTSTVDRDGALTSYNYDPMGDLTNRTMPGSLQYQATFNNAGQMLAEQNFGGGNATRTTTYNYYASGNPFAGLLQTKTDGRGVSCAYSYDDRFRQSSMTYSGSLPEQNLTTTWQYDARNLVTGITEQFASTNTGPNTGITRKYDPYAQLFSESVNAGSASYGDYQGWDATGRRTQLGFGDTSYSFTWRADGNLLTVANPTGSGAYSYDTAGMLTNRLVGNRVTGITSRDGEGRPLFITTTVNLLNELTESLTWSGDGLLTAHTLARADFTDPHIYTYASLSRRLLQEQLNLNGSTSWTNTLGYDGGGSAGPGVLTQMGVANTASNDWSGGIDAFSRIATETNSTIQFPAYGHVNGLSAFLSAWLDNQPVSISVTGTNAMQWRALLELSPGTHQLKVSALHPSEIFTAWATNSFTNAMAYQATVDSYDAAGNITNRVWMNPGGTVERTQTLSWDARGRLHAVTDRDANNSGYNWSAVYDPFNRRVQTTTVLVSNNVAASTPPESINSAFDPQVEFLELGVSYGDQTVWKLYGPDLNGQYGGRNGTGGLDGLSPYLNFFNPVISDFRGNILAEVTNGVVSWIPARPTGYGAVPGYRPVALANDADLAQSSVWRGHWVDITGYYNIGLRPYDPVSGRWLTFDSAWNERDPNYYSFCGGDPINGFDPDGRIAANMYHKVVNGFQSVMSNYGAAQNLEVSAQQWSLSSALGNTQAADKWNAQIDQNIGFLNAQHQQMQDAYNMYYSFYGNSSLLAYNAILNPMVNTEVSAGELNSGLGMQPWNSGQTLDYNQKVDAASEVILGGTKTVATAVGIEGIGAGSLSAFNSYANASIDASLPSGLNIAGLDNAGAGGTVTLYRGTTYYDALETVQNGAFDASRLAQMQASASYLPGLYLTSQEATANYYAELAGYQGRGGGPGTLQVTVPQSDFNALMQQYNIQYETPVARPPVPGQTETLIPPAALNDFNNMMNVSHH